LARRRISPAADRWSSRQPDLSLWRRISIFVRSAGEQVDTVLLGLFGGSMPLASHHCAMRLRRTKLGVGAVLMSFCCVFGQVSCPAPSHFSMQERS